MEIRKYKQSDCRILTELFYHTVHTVNAKDYTKEQLDVWADGKADLKKWNQSFQEHYSIVAVENETIAGFGDIDLTGYLDRLFVHADYQGKGLRSYLRPIGAGGSREYYHSRFYYSKTFFSKKEDTEFSKNSR